MNKEMPPRKRTTWNIAVILIPHAYTSSLCLLRDAVSDPRTKTPARMERRSVIHAHVSIPIDVALPEIISLIKVALRTSVAEAIVVMCLDHSDTMSKALRLMGVGSAGLALIPAKGLPTERKYSAKLPVHLFYNADQ